MYRGSGPRIFPIIVVILVVALIIAALVSVGRMLFTGGDGSTGSGDAATGVVDALRNTSDGRAVRWTVRGPIVADEKFRSYQITVSPSERVFVTYSGYLDQVIDTKTYPNNTAGYEQFVYALDKTGLGKVRNAPDEDLRGACATNGFAYMFETLSNGTTNNTLWTTSCKGTKGTLTAKVPQVHALFANQIPDFEPIFTTDSY